MYVNKRNLSENIKTVDEVENNGGVRSTVDAGHTPEENFPIKNGSWIQIGKIFYNPKKVLGTGGMGTTIFAGSYLKRDVAIKLSKDRWSANREADLIIEADDHPNIIRHYTMEYCDKFVYMALSYTAGNLKELVERKFHVVIHRIDILHQVLTGLNHLHGLRHPIIRPDLKPRNILIYVPKNNEPPRAMISDLSSSRQLTFERNSQKWTFSDMSKMDIFNFGILVYYTWTSGHHPFGDKPFLREINVLSGKYNLQHLDSKKDNLCVHIIQNLINHNPRDRPTSWVALTHPFFWSKQKIREFIIDTSNVLEKRDPELLEAIENKSGDVLTNQGHNWMFMIDEEVRVYLVTSGHVRNRNYDGSKISHLLRAVRNLANHYQVLPDDIKLLLGTLSEGFMNYWMSKFPNMVLYTYLTLKPFGSDTEGPGSWRHRWT